MMTADEAREQLRAIFGCADKVSVDIDSKGMMTVKMYGGAQDWDLTTIARTLHRQPESLIEIIQLLNPDVTVNKPD